MKVIANQIHIEVEDSAPPTGTSTSISSSASASTSTSASASASPPALPVVLLIMGLGMQLVSWPPGLVRSLVNAGFRVIRFDNRDSGLSDKFDHLGQPNMLWQGMKYKLGLKIRAPYSLQDKALDALGVLDALKIDQAHIVGVSMGGMVAQRVALLAPERTMSLTSIMSSSGARGLPAAKPAITRLLLGRPANGSLEAAIERSVKVFKAIGSPGFPIDDDDRRAAVAYSLHRSYHPPGVLRQMVAIVADTTRAAELPNITARTLVLHGKADPLVPFACGQDTARRIPGARLVGIDGMGHDLPPGAVDQLLTHLIPHLQASEPDSRQPLRPA